MSNSHDGRRAAEAPRAGAPRGRASRGRASRGRASPPAPSGDTPARGPGAGAPPGGPAASELPPGELSGVDLNLLVAFDLLVRERSVTRAAERAGVTQSAMSHVLRRLRELFGDPLLVRGAGGLALTPRAEALVVPLRSGLVTLGRALAEPDGFAPAAARRAFRIASPDLFDVVVVPALLARIRRDAPHVDIAIVPAAGRQVHERLETGELDAVIKPGLDAARPERAGEATPGLVRRTLFHDRFVCFLRAGHAALGSRRRGEGAALSLASYLALSHALVSITGEGHGLVDEVLAQRGLTRRIALRIPHFTSALAIIARSDLILTAPAALAGFIPGDGPVVVLPPPLRLPTHSINLVWHERFSLDPGHRWLREVVVDVARSAMPAL